MLAQHVLFTGWMGYGVAYAMGQFQLYLMSEPLVVYMSMAAIYWFFMGSFMTGESPNLALRDTVGLPRKRIGPNAFHLVL